jgi:acyl carrier protein
MLIRGVSEAPSCNISVLTHDSFDTEILAIVKRLSRRPVEPTPDHELLADLGFDSLQVLELVGELEDHFNIAVPLNALTHIRTVGQIMAEVRRLVAEQDTVRQ